MMAPTLTESCSGFWFRSIALFLHTPSQMPHLPSLRYRQLSSMYVTRGIA